MTMMTSAYASKLIRKLEDDKAYWRTVENDSYLYTAASDEEPLIPEYDYKEVAAKIEEIDEKICKIKHAINLANVTNQLQISDRLMSVDTILVRMAQLNSRKNFLNNMRRHQPKARLNSSFSSPKKGVVEYMYINYDLELVKKEYERIDAEIAEMQLQLDRYNQTVEFQVEI